MQPFPHQYSAAAVAPVEGDVSLESQGLGPIPSAAPIEFGGPGDRWSPETLLVAAVADCFALTFRAVAAVSKLPWSALRCDVAGTVDRVERTPQFTELVVRASLDVPAGTDRQLAERVLAKAKQACLVTNSLKAACQIETSVRAT